MENELSNYGFFQDFEDNYIIHTSEQASHIIYTTYISGSPINRVSYSRVVFIHLNRILQEYIFEETNVLTFVFSKKRRMNLNSVGL